jgi:hypothetical protein
MQSGGERAVATILFLISLQMCSQAPFRLVDEVYCGLFSVSLCLVRLFVGRSVALYVSAECGDLTYSSVLDAVESETQLHAS